MKREHLEDPGVDGKTILRWIFRKWDGGVDWIDLAQDRDRWRTLGSATKFGEFLDFLQTC